MWGMVLFWDFLLGLLRTWNISFGDFVGYARPLLCLLRLTAAAHAEPGRL